MASDDTLTVELGFWQSKLSIAQADSLASTFSKTFSSILRNPRVFTHDLDMLSSRDRTQITQWNSFAMTAVECCVHHEFEQQAKRRPHAMAIDGWDGKMTYGMLNNRVTALASHLANIGVGPEVMVPIYFEKSMWSIIAMMGILKAGGAFVPLDPDAPISRLEFIVKEVGAKVVISSVSQSRKANGQAKNIIVLGTNYNSLPYPLTKPSTPVTPSNLA